MVNRQTIDFTIKIQKLQIICKKSSALAQKLDKNSLTYDKMKNVHGLLGHPLHRLLIHIFLNNAF